jgi:uncharacterized protein (DUF1800 family)
MGVADVPRYQGPFGRAQAERLLWRAGFGGSRARADKLAAKGLQKAVRSLTRPRNTDLVGPKPTDGDNPIAPNDAWGHDVLWWLDRTVRTRAPAIERMALIWHDWFATGDVSSQKLSIQQAKLFRKHALGSFEELLLDVTHDPAMLIWLSGIDNNKYAPNENYARELMELFTLGASDETGYPYSEDDVREQARALTGWTADWDDDVGYVNFRFSESRHDTGLKTVFGQTGNFDWRDSCRLVLTHPAHAPYFVNRLWAHFVAAPLDPATAAALEDLYLERDYAIRPVVEAILMHPAFYAGPSLVKPPVVAIAGMLRARGRGIDIDAWAWVSDMAGQRLFRPPNVSGWDETRWLDTSSFRGRWYSVAEVLDPDELDHDTYDVDETPQEALAAALAYWGNPSLSAETQARLLAFASGVEGLITADWQRRAFRADRQMCLRTLIAASPDYQTS